MIDIEDAERFADETDRAASITEHTTKEAIDKVLRNKEQAPYWFESPFCIKCEQEIPADRLATGAFRCITCQTAKEHHDRNHRKS